MLVRVKKKRLFNIPRVSHKFNRFELGLRRHTRETKNANLPASLFNKIFRKYSGEYLSIQARQVISGRIRFATREFIAFM